MLLQNVPADYVISSNDWIMNYQKMGIGSGPQTSQDKQLLQFSGYSHIQLPPMVFGSPLTFEFYAKWSNTAAAGQVLACGVGSGTEEISIASIGGSHDILIFYNIDAWNFRAFGARGSEKDFLLTQ